MDKKEKRNDWHLVGNPKIPEFLSASLENEKVSVSYVFLGPQNLGKTTLAKFFSQSLLCEDRQKNDLVLPCEKCSSCRQMTGNTGGEAEDNLSALHSDFHLIRREKDKKNISIEQIREFIKILHLSSFLNSYKIGIIKNAEALSSEAGNALLKTLEEPQKKVVIILIASQIENIPETIASRSQILNFYPVAREDVYDYLVKVKGARRSQAKNISHLSLGRPALAIKFLEDPDFYNNYLEKGEIFLEFLNQDLNQRIKTISQIFKSSASGQEGAREALNLISIWRGVARDFLLLHCGHKDLIQFEALKEKIEPWENKFSFSVLLKMIAGLQTGEKQIKGNVNPKLALENSVCNLI